MRPAGVMIYYVRMKTRTRPLRLFRFATRPPRGSRQITLPLNTLSLVPDPLGVMQSCQNCLGDNCEKRICAEIQAYLPEYRRSFPDFDIRPDKFKLMLLSIMDSCDEICKNKMKSDKDYLDYMKNHFEECAK